MNRIAAIVCGAGVSSTFLARALRALAVERGLEWNVEPLAEDQLPHRIDDLGLVLIGHHLADRFSELRAALALSGVPAELLETADPAAAAEQGLALLQSHETTRRSGADRSSKGHSHG